MKATSEVGDSLRNIQSKARENVQAVDAAAQEIVTSANAAEQAAEDVDIRRMGIEAGELELHGGLGDGLLHLAAHDVGFLHELPDPTAPAGPEAELQESDGDNRSRDGSDGTDESLLAADFLANIFAEDGGLEVGKDLRTVGMHELKRRKSPSR